MLTSWFIHRHNIIQYIYIYLYTTINYIDLRSFYAIIICNISNRYKNYIKFKIIITPFFLTITKWHDVFSFFFIGCFWNNVLHHWHHFVEFYLQRYNSAKNIKVYYYVVKFARSTNGFKAVFIGKKHPNLNFFEAALHIVDYF